MHTANGKDIKTDLYVTDPTKILDYYYLRV